MLLQVTIKITKNRRQSRALVWNPKSSQCPLGIGLLCRDTPVGSTGFYAGITAFVLAQEGGKEPELKDTGGKNFLKTKCRSRASTFTFV
jgi:hypothetical protein